MNSTATCPTAEAVRLMESVLRDGRPLADEYPLVFAPGFGGRVVARSLTYPTGEEEVVAACAALPRTVVTPAASFDVGLIGSVATASEHRGKGHGRGVVASAEEDVSSSGAVCSMLWADDSEWYKSLGWIPVGRELVYVVQRGIELLMPEPEGAREATARDFASIHEIYAQHSRRTDRSAAESAALLAGPGIQNLVIERDGAVVAYAALGRGEDLANVVHEWGGPIEDVLALIRAHLERSLAEGRDEVYVMVPPGERELTSFFDFTRTPGADGILCMAKLASTDAAARLLQQVSPAGVTATAVGDERIRMQGPGGDVVLTGPEVLLTLFPPRSDRTVVEVVESQIGAPLEALPLDPFFWGLDSI